MELPQAGDLAGAPRPPDFSGVPGYGPDDIAANREGRLSAAQRRPASMQAMRFPFFWTLMSAVGAFALVTSGRLAPWLDWLAVAAFAGVAALAWRAYRRSMAEIDGGVVEAVEGDAWLETDSTDEGVEHLHLHIGGRVLSTTLHPGFRFKFVDGGPYRAYYLPRMAHVVSVEPLPGWRPVPRPED